MSLIADNIRKLLHEQDETARNLSLSLGKSAGYIQNILDGRSKSPRRETLEAIAKHFNVPLAFLLGVLDESSPTPHMWETAIEFVIEEDHKWQDRPVKWRTKRITYALSVCARDGITETEKIKSKIREHLDAP